MLGFGYDFKDYYAVFFLARYWGDKECDIYVDMGIILLAESIWAQF